MPRTKSFDQVEILDKATDLFWQQGYNATPPQTILDGTGLSRSSLYDTYGDKHSLFIKCLRHYRETETVAGIRYLDDAPDPAAAIRRLFMGYWDFAQRYRQGKGCLMVNTLNEVAPHDAEVAEIVEENRQALEDAYYRAVRRGQQMGKIKSATPPRAIARYLVNNLWGLTTQIKLGIEKKIADDIVKVVLSVL
ncbi:MAG TPA: TetR/AcrR family transcriptional regulator [Puia sp.]|jgi:TetR/AcrR family transcriptional repressor of nem operon|nr:TetR/AcrR family transcriptional regulator [Puia sp.]